MAITVLLAGGDADQIGRAVDVTDLLGPAGSTVFGAASVWMMLNNRLRTAERDAGDAVKDVEQLEVTVASLTKRLDDLERGRLAAEKDIERWRRATRSAETHLDHIRQSLRTLLLLAKNDGKPNEALLAEVSGLFDRPSPRIHEDSM